MKLEKEELDAKQKDKCDNETWDAASAALQKKLEHSIGHNHTLEKKARELERDYLDVNQQYKRPTDKERDDKLGARCAHA